jgi:hypothetical protein
LAVKPSTRDVQYFASPLDARIETSAWSTAAGLSSAAKRHLQQLWTLRAACYVILTINVLLNLVWVASTRRELNDLGSFLHSGAAFRAGLNPYEYYPWLRPPPISAEALNLNPPISVYLFEGLSYFSISFVETAFVVGSGLLLAVSLGLLFLAYRDKRDPLTFLVVLSFAGIWHMFWYLQLYAPLVLAIVGSWLLMRRGNLVWAGILIGLVVAIKPNYALLPLLLIAAGYYSVALPALGTAALISLIPLLLDGPQIYRQWLDLTMGFEGLDWTSNASLESVTARLEIPYLGFALTVAVLLGVIYWQRRARPGLLDATAVGLMAVVLAGPVSWAGYTLFLLPFLFSRQWDRKLWLAVLLLSVPFSPQGAASTAGLSLIASSIHLPGGLMATLALIGDLVSPITRSVYAWAVVLLLVTMLRSANTRARDEQRLLIEPSHSVAEGDGPWLNR